MTLRPISPRLLLLATLGLVGSLARSGGRRGLDGRAGRQPLRRRPRGLPLHGEPGRAGRGRPRRRQPRHRAAAARAVAPRSASVRLDRDDVTVPPGESAEVPFASRSPATPRPATTWVASSPPTAGQRVEIPIRLRVGGPLKPSLSVEDVAVHYSGGDATVTYTVHNTGNAILTARQAVSVSGPFGRWAVACGEARRLARAAAGWPLEGVRAAARCHPRAAADGDTSRSSRCSPTRRARPRRSPPRGLGARLGRPVDAALGCRRPVRARRRGPGVQAPAALSRHDGVGAA